MGFDNIEYAQADILEIGGIDRRFDVISSSGVLHHLANPEQGWSTLLSLLRPGGCMNIGLYSERARRNLVIAQRWLVERGFTPSVEDIRRARQELIARTNTNDSMNDVRKFADFYSTSECRDLLFHTQEHQYTIPAIHEFLEKNNLEFLGFMLKQSSALTGSMPPAAISTLVIFAPHFRPLRPVQPVDHPRPCCSDLSVPNSVIFGRKFE